MLDPFILADFVISVEGTIVYYGCIRNDDLIQVIIFGQERTPDTSFNFNGKFFTSSLCSFYGCLVTNS